MSDLIGSLTDKDNIRGITLSSQNIDLFNIIEQAQSREEAVENIYEYLDGILQANRLSKEMNSQGLNTTQKIKRVVDKATSVPDKEAFLKFLLANAMQIRANWDTKESLEKLFEGQEVDSTYIDTILDMKKYFAHQTHGILTFLVDKDGQTINPDGEVIEVDKQKTYQKVEALYEYIIGNLENGENRFNRLTLDGQGKFGTVAGIMRTENEAQAKPNEYNLQPLIQGYEFARAHNMDIRINALVFFKDFPDRLIGENADTYRIALENYGRAIASVANEYGQMGVPTTIDMFNEFVDYNAPFSERTNNWMSKLSVEDLCRIALKLKQEMPDVDFGYNDWNFENPEKRKTIFEVIGKIQEFERQNNCKIIDHIGTQCHTSINDLEGLRKSIEELQQFGLPVDITELDISKGLDGVDYESATPEELRAIRKYEQKLQNDMMKMMSEFVRDGKIRGITSWSITDELCCDFCDGKQASVTGMSYDTKTGFTFSGKDMDKEIEMTLEEMQLIQKHISRIRESKQEQVNKNPTQDFCFHTHTQRCGHGAKDTGDEEWVEHAIKGGIKKLAFTDHIPLPDGMNHKANSRMDIAEVGTYLTSIHYLQEKYKGQIEIESGFEFEYSDRDLAHLQELKSKTDKMVLGQHFVIDDNGQEHGIVRGKGGKQISDEVLDLYAKSIISAMDKDLPDVIAHPDLFMQARDSFGAKEEEITRAICRKAIEKGIPLEINFGKIASKVESKMPLDELKKRIPYPSPEFWKIVAEETKLARENGQDLLVIYGKDAHFPEQLSTEKDYEIARAIIGEQTLEQLHIVTKHKELETQTKSIQGLVQESIQGVPNFTSLDEIEQAQARQQRALIEQREEQENSQNK
ncbi:MAG: endo-1,4-beta-xylanase [Clostridia bacterium]|nr:endo-1,4-beta-xylanase [Clostridia bacterium]